VIEPEVFYRYLTEHGIDFYTGVPDSLLKNFCAVITDNASEENHIIAANEGNAISIALGYYMATKKIALVYMQNSGLGNAINPLVSLADKEVYAIPMLMMIGWRGEPGVKDEPQHIKQGFITLELLKTIGVPYEILDSTATSDEIHNKIDNLIKHSKKHSKPCALVVKKNVFNSYTLNKNQNYNRPLKREDAIQIIVNTIDVDDVIVSTTGVASRELFEYREKNCQGHKRDFLTVGGMGHASQIALGIALKKRKKRVFCLDGDGSFLMHMGGVAIVANSGLKNFKHIILNNCAHDSVGGQPTIASKIDIQGLAKSLGYKWVQQAITSEEIKSKLLDLINYSGVGLLEIQLSKGYRGNLGRPTTTPNQNKLEFMKFLDD
jgi:phosphonopyruvate decarboxylase